MRPVLMALIFGIVGTVVLTSLGIWQLQRLAWKENILAEIETRIAGSIQALPDAPDVAAHRFLPVQVTGDFDGQDVAVFLSHAGGPIYRLVAAFETDGRRILIDRGGINAATRPTPERRTKPMTGVTVVGNLHWPDEVDSWTPAPDAEGVFFGRDLDAIARLLNTEPILVVARDVSSNLAPATLLPVTSTGIPNNHLGYAVQWFGLALVWAGMTLFFLWRKARRKVED